VGEACIALDVRSLPKDEPQKEECNECWVTVITLVWASMKGNWLSSLSTEKSQLLQLAKRRSERGDEGKSVPAVTQAMESQELEEREEASSSAQSSQDQSSEPMKVCCGCGSYPAKKRCGK